MAAAGAEFDHDDEIEVSLTRGLDDFFSSRELYALRDETKRAIGSLVGSVVPATWQALYRKSPQKGLELIFESSKRDNQQLVYQFCDAFLARNPPAEDLCLMFRWAYSSGSYWGAAYLGPPLIEKTGRIDELEPVNPIPIVSLPGDRVDILNLVLEFMRVNPRDPEDWDEDFYHGMKSAAGRAIYSGNPECFFACVRWLEENRIEDGPFGFLIGDNVHLDDGNEVSNFLAAAHGGNIRIFDYLVTLDPEVMTRQNFHWIVEICLQATQMKNKELARHIINRMRDVCPVPIKQRLITLLKSINSFSEWRYAKHVFGL